MDQKMAGNLRGLVNRPEWDYLLVLLSQMNTDCHERLETCSPETLKGIQGEVKVIKDLLTLRSTVNTIMDVK